MTRVHGFTDYIGTSGGITSAGNYHILPSDDLFVSGINLYVDIDGFGNEDGSIRFRNRNAFQIESSGSISMATKNNLSLLCGGDFSIGDSDYSDAFTPYDYNHYFRNEWNLKGLGVVTFGSSDYNANNTPSYQLQYSTVRIANLVNYFGQGEHGLDVNENLTTLSSADDLWLKSKQQIIFLGDSTFSSTATPTGIHSYASSVIQTRVGGIIEGETVACGYDIVNGNLGIVTLNGKIPTVNGSGIALADNYPCRCYFQGVLDSDIPCSTSETNITWDSIEKFNITHTDGDYRIYLPNIGTYFITVELGAKYFIGGRKQIIKLRHYNGSIISVKSERRMSTSHEGANTITTIYILSTTTINDYIYVRANFTAESLDSVWEKDWSGITIMSI